MTVKDFFRGAFYLPATIFSGMTNLLLGSYKRDNDDIIIPDKGRTNINWSLLGLILYPILRVGLATSNLIYKRKLDIAIAFWLSLLAGGATALTVFLWPAALT